MLEQFFSEACQWARDHTRQILKEYDIYLHAYRDSLGEEEEIEKTKRLIKYFEENRKGLSPWMERGGYDLR